PQASEAAGPADGSAPWDGPADAAVAAPQDTVAAVPLKSREAIARAARLSSSQVVMIEKIQKQAAPELVAAVRSGAISINTAAAVATLPEEEQRAAAVAGKDELRHAAKRARDARRKPRAHIPQDGSAPGADAGEGEAAQASSPAHDDIEALRRRVAGLEAENEALRQEVARLRARAGT
ncbi:plasmid replication/partition related protein, partial [Paracidovorax cattleyae]